MGGAEQQPGVMGTSWDALIMITDIVGFSNHEQWYQVRMVQHLFRSLMAAPVIVSDNDGALLLAGGGPTLPPHRARHARSPLPAA